MNSKSMAALIGLLLTAGLSAGSPAIGATVSFSGLISNSCILSIPTTGVLVADAAGTTLRSDSGVGARSATLTVAALGSSPTLTFATPQATGPAGATPDSVEYSYSASGSGASRGFGSTSSTASSNLIDTFVVNGKIARAAGFPSGTYAMTIEVTCGQ